MKRKRKNTKDVMIRSSAAEYLTYASATGGQEGAVELRYEDENLWLSQKLIAELYGVSVSAVNQHLKRLLRDSELDASGIKKYLITATDGKKREMKWRQNVTG
ncbi:MAG: winged helix-turn-helix transcriptional regulator [Candidatus Moranbacteria bacterium]|nr:winged helix-turn-helix transcriptional regulator [Candidatus Moranbacteria bacterium]